MLDWFWPRQSGPEEPQPNAKDFFSAEDTDNLNAVDQVMSFRLAQVDERTRTVESKLVALLTLGSVLTTVVAAGLAAATTFGALADDDLWFAIPAMLLVVYVALQILRSLWATVNGLMRRGYLQLRPDDITPRANEDIGVYRIRLLNLKANHMNQNEWVTNQKVGNMAVAHIALRNALTATFGLIVLTLAFGVCQLL